MRDNEDYIKSGVFGGNQVGKTSWLVKQSKAIYNTRECDKVIFYTDQNPPALERFHRIEAIEQLSKFKHGIVKFYNYKDPMQGLQDMMDLCYNEGFKGGEDVGGAMIYDDCKNYMKSSNEGAVTRWMANHRTYYWDLYFVGHDYKQMPRYVRERLEVYNTFKVMTNTSAKELEDLGYLDAEGLYEAYMRSMIDDDFRAVNFVDVKQFFKKFKEKMLANAKK